jgi:putative flippase GtrA
MAVQPPPRALAKQFVSFTLVGLTGLAVDAGAFMLLTRSFLWSIAVARTASVCGAILTTWVLNRSLTFAQQRSRRRGVELVLYAAVQAGGLVVNIGVFTLCLWLVPALRATPLVPLLLGCAAGFAFNFTALRTLVFRRIRDAAATDAA